MLLLLITTTLLAENRLAPATPRGQQAGPPSTNSPLLDSLLHTTPLLTRVATHSQYELQIIYTQINRDAQNIPHFTEHTYHLNPHHYFNPASLVKLPVCLLALEKLHTLPNVTPRSIMATGTAYRCQIPVPFAAPADSDRTATVGNYIKRMLLVSDNLAYNRLYEFLGQRPLNERLRELGYPNVRITRRFAPCDTAANRHTNPITFLTPKPTPYISSPPSSTRFHTAAPWPRPPRPRLPSRPPPHPEPYDFTTANHLPLPAITNLLKPLSSQKPFPPPNTPSSPPADYAFLRRYLHATPHESGYSLYKAPGYFDAYKKYLYYGRNPALPQEKALRSYNIVGMSHGYLADIAYFADSLHQSEFLLSAVLYVNADGILNDGAYEYDSVGLPFLAQLGQQIRHYEAHRPRQFSPNLTEFFAPEPIR